MEDKSDKPEGPSPQGPVAPPPPRKRKYHKQIYGGVVALAVLVLLTFYYFRYIAPFVDTDDAFIDGYTSLIAPRVSGPVIHLLIRDNQEVKKGDLLVEIDPSDYETAVAQARADLAAAQSQLDSAKAQVDVSETKVIQAQAAVVSAEAINERAEADLKRYQTVESRAISKTSFDQTQAEARSAAADLQSAQSQVESAVAQVTLSKANVETANASVQQAEARLKQAELNLSYTKIVAPFDGRITARSVQTGNFLQPGQAMFALVPRYVWVTANFKETQLTFMRAGQPVTVRVDAYPQQRFRAHVDSLQAGTGARFSLLPPENAVGNYVKIVQRVPVKIVFDEELPTNLDISPGFSVEPTVRIK
ncbi:MAG TPA: HlyD family secretion protein [Candidatus Sulfotelmatobacter sp.]|nr:HlyD family secretion protein [Candidatus Sulfotelmatobacter sp.]